MAFNLASAYVEISEKGASGVQSAIGRVTDRVHELAKAPVDAIAGKFGGLKEHILGMLNPVSMLTSAIAALGAGAGIGEIIGMGARLERTRTDFDQLTRSSAATDQMLGALKKQFAGTSIDSDQYKAVAKELLAEGAAAAEVPGKLKVLGNIAAATGDSLEGMATAMHRAELTGKVTARTLMSMPAVVEELNKMYPQLGGNIMEAAESGQIGIKQLQAAVNNLGGGSGKFSNAMKAQQETLIGQWDIAKGKLGKIFSSIGDDIITGFDLPGVVGKVGGWLEWFQTTYGGIIKGVFAEIGDVAKGVFGWIGDHKVLVGTIAACLAP